eukprot:gene8605-11629_t
MEINSIARIGPLSGYSLNNEEVSGLEVGMLQRKLQENLVGKMYFWGKIFGSTQDYLIVHNINPFDEFPVKKFYFCTTSDYTLRALPPITEEYEKQASVITSAFLGDPSFFAYNGEDPEPEDPEAPPVERFREVHRLTFTIKKIDHDCALLPRGAIALDTTKKVIINGNYVGLSYETSLHLRAYVHFRKPENLQGQALLNRPGILKTDDFMDCIDKDAPKEMWSITHDSAGMVAHIRNLYWEGYSFYTVIKSNEFGGAYFGTGVPNYDIVFML